MSNANKVEQLLAKPPSAGELLECLARGQSVTVATQTRSTTVRQKHQLAWASKGHDFFIDRKGLPMMIGSVNRGKPKYVCIAYCYITISS